MWWQQGETYQEEILVGFWSAFVVVGSIHWQHVWGGKGHWVCTAVSHRGCFGGSGFLLVGFALAMIISWMQHLNAAVIAKRSNRYGRCGGVWGVVQG